MAPAASLPVVPDSSLKNDLYQHGFDICVPFHPTWYNALLDTESAMDDLRRLPVADDPVESSSVSAYLIGNTKFLWRHFVAWCRVQENEQGSLPDHPLDTYCEQKIRAAFNNSLQIKKCEFFWSFEYSPEKLVSMQRVAVGAGFAYHDVNTQLTIHPEYGTWTSYRAVVVVSENGSNNNNKSHSAVPLPPPRVPKLLTVQEEQKAAAAMKHALSLSDTTALCQQLHKSIVDISICQAWIAMRDTVERGKAEYRFDDEQLLYHYTKDVQYLKDT
jgi:hypothetical protein